MEQVRTRLWQSTLFQGNRPQNDRWTGTELGQTATVREGYPPLRILANMETTLDDDTLESIETVLARSWTRPSVV